MDKTKYKLIDAFFVWGLCLLIFGIAGTLLSRLIGIWAFYLCEAAAVAVVLIVAHLTGLKRQKLLSLGAHKLSLTSGGALIWAGALLAAIPFFLFSHLLVPNFAVTCFHVYDYTSSHIAVAGFVLVAALSETLLFDGFLYQRVKALSKGWLTALVLGLAYGIYHLDLYVLFPLTLAGIAISYIRAHSGGLLLPFALRLVTVTLSLAYLQASDTAEALAGSAMGLLQVVGFTMIFVGAAIPAVALGVRVLGGWKARSSFENCMIVIIAIVLIASGCGIASL